MTGSSQTPHHSMEMEPFKTTHDSLTSAPSLESLEIDEAEPTPRVLPPQRAALLPEPAIAKPEPPARMLSLNQQQRESIRQRLSDAASTVQCYRGDLVELTKSPPPIPIAIQERRSLHSEPTRILPVSTQLDRQVDAAWADDWGQKYGANANREIADPALAPAQRQRPWRRRLLFAAVCAAGLASFGLLGHWAGIQLVAHSVHAEPIPSALPKRFEQKRTSSQTSESPAEPRAVTAVGITAEAPAVQQKEALPPVSTAQHGDEVLSDASPQSHQESALVEPESPARFLWEESNSPLVIVEKPIVAKRSARAKTNSRQRSAHSARVRKPAKQPPLIETPEAAPPAATLEQLIESVPTRATSFGESMIPMEDLGASAKANQGPVHR